MRDPYEVLGISRDATDDEVNTAYRKLVKQYHPDKYVGNPLADLAAEKIREINAAYDAVMNERKNGTNGQSSYQSSNSDFDVNRIRNLINQNKLAEAEALLNSVHVRNAEWHYLMGMVLKKKGWYDMAYQHLNRAVNLDPNNNEYKSAFNGMDYSGSMYRNVGNAGGYDSDCCGMCQGLICADCCCEACGGNLIPCIGCR